MREDYHWFFHVCGEFFLNFFFLLLEALWLK